MHITIDLEECSFDPFLANLSVCKINGRFIKEIAAIENVPMYQAKAICNALKAANPEDYKTNAILKLVPKETQRELI